MRRRLYDLMYRWGAPWETGPREELVRLVDSGRLASEVLAPGRALDLGCGTGANTVFLAERGFDVVGVDFSPVALVKADRRAERAGVAEHVRFVRADLTSTAMADVGGPFDLLVDYGTLDDLSQDGRRLMAANVVSLARPGAAFLLWAFYAARSELPLISFDGPSRVSGAMEPGEERDLFGAAFEIERLATPPEGSGFACFLMSRVG